jgi:hypothetical protein
MNDEKNMVWVGILNEIPETKKEVYYIPKQYDKKYMGLYKGTDKIPYFLTKEECQAWCDNNPYNKNK